MESLLHYVWKHRLYDEQEMRASDGASLEIVDTGIYNRNAGPDFFNSKVKMGSNLWVGNVEIHEKSSDWYHHGHDRDKLYNSVILHVVENIDHKEIRDQSGRLIPQWEMPVLQSVRDNYQYLLHSDSDIPCLGRIREIPEIYLNDWKTALLTERLDRKARDIIRLCEERQNDWNEALYITLARNFGFGLNNDAFERLAISLPLKIILKHSNSPLQTEALFLGQAGLLDDEDLADDYFDSLKKEYLFLKDKYGLKPLDGHIFRSLRVRPNNFPHIKLVQLAGIVSGRQGLFSELTEMESERKIRAFFNSEISEYWKTHYRFGKTSPRSEKRLGMSAILILVINVAAPLFFAYGKKKNLSEYIDRAMNLLDTVGAESNHIVTQFVRAGFPVSNAGDTQALIQLKREYCEKKKCIFCRIGHKMLAREAGQIAKK